MDEIGWLWDGSDIITTMDLTSFPFVRCEAVRLEAPAPISTCLSLGR